MTAGPDARRHERGSYCASEAKGSCRFDQNQTGRVQFVLSCNYCSTDFSRGACQNLNQHY